MKRLYIDLDDTYKDTERYFRKILTSEGIVIPQGITSVYDLLRYSTPLKEYYKDDNLPVFNLLNTLFVNGFTEVCDSVYSVFKNIMSMYSVIPNRDGVSSSWDLLRSEYKITFVSAYVLECEKAAKEEFARSLGVDAIIVPYHEKPSLSLGVDSIIVDNDPEVLSCIGAGKKVLMYSPYSPIDVEVPSFCIVQDWYELCDLLMEVDLRDEFRNGIYAGIPLSGRVEVGA